MADEAIPRQTFNIRNIATRSVTLYPARAQVIRDINDIELKPGTNEIEIYGLTPTADESSIKVDGKGAATITDMSVELLPNRESFHDVYPSDSEEEDGDESDEDQDHPMTDQIRALEDKIKNISDEMENEEEKKRSGSARLAILKLYGDSIAKDRPDDLSSFLTSYATERQKAYDVIFASDNRIKILEKQSRSSHLDHAKALKKAKSASIKAMKTKEKELKKKQRVREDKEKSKLRLKEERVQFWPRKVYRVVVSLDTNVNMTPASSRRGSIDTVGKPVVENPGSDTSNISLSISYITSAACWAPRYDLSLETKNNTGLVIYRAELCNTTSETWSDAKIILSTSQTAFQGLGDSIPIMDAWHIKLAKKQQNNADSTSGALTSSQEQHYKQNNSMAHGQPKHEPRAVLFGVGSAQKKETLSNYLMQKEQAQMAMQQQQQQQQYQRAMPQESAFGAKRSREAQAAVQPQNQNMLFGNLHAAPAEGNPSASHLPRSRFNGVGAEMASGYQLSSSDEVMGDGLFDEDDMTEIPELPSLATQESTWSESGLTATYDIPGLRTIAPSHTTRRQKIASIHLKDINLSYLMVPKLRAAAFLKARVYNTSSITLLKGPCGLTLDGSFLGNTTIPRCSAGDLFRLSLGVDPSVSVTYSKPAVKRSQTGVFQKEGSGIYTRTVTVTNTKANQVLEGIIIDQIPISEDERLRIDILQPGGLHSEGASATTGIGIPAVGKVTEKWGKATATLRKNGELWWDVKIEPGRAVKLVLEYEARFPTTEIMVGA